MAPVFASGTNAKRWSRLAVLMLVLGAQARPLEARGPEQPGALLRARRIPQARALLEGRSEGGRAREDGRGLSMRAGSPRTSGGKAAGLSWAPLDDEIEARWSAERPGEVSLRGAGVEVRVRREGAGPAAAHDGLAVQAGARRGEGSLWVGGARELEELVEIPPGRGEVSYRVEMPRGFSLVRVAGGLVEVRDAQGLARLRMSAREAWLDDGRQQAPRVEVEGDRVRIETEGGASGGLLDPSWASAGTLALSRRWHRGIMRADGKVLLAGGDTLGVGICELFDPELRVFTTTAQLLEPRDHPYLFRRADGKIVVIGGQVSGGTEPATKIEVYSPEQGSTPASFAKLGDLDRAGVAFAPLLDGGLLLAGGFEGGKASKKIERLDTETGQLTSLGELQQARSWATAAALPGGRVLVAGGDESTRAEVFDPATGSTELAGELAAGKSPLLAVLGSGDALVAPLWGENGASARWNAFTGLFHEHSKWGDGVYHPASLLLLPTGQALAAGGEDRGMRLYDPVLDAWRELGFLDNWLTMTTLPTGLVLMTGTSKDTAVGTGYLLRLEPPVDRGPPTPPFLSMSDLARLPDGSVMGTFETSATVIFRPDLTRTETLDAPVSQTRGKLTPLASGRVLLSGGIELGGKLNERLAIFDPETRRWGVGPRLPTGVFEHTATRLLDGRVLLAGGYMGGSSRALMVWDEKSAEMVPYIDQVLQRDRVAHTATVLESGEVLVVGGTETGQPAEIIDPASLTSQTLSETLGPRVGHTATLLPGGDVLIFGGNSLSQGLSPAEPWALRFDAKSRTFSPVSRAYPRLRSSATRLLDGRVLLAGGYTLGANQEFSLLNSVELYDPVAGTFSEGGSSPELVYEQRAALMADGRVLLAGNIENPEAVIQGVSSQVYDPVSKTFSAPQGPPVPILSGASCGPLPSGALLFSGGLQQGKPTGALVRFSADTDTFELQGGQLSPPRAWHSTTMLTSGQLLLAGGVGAAGVPVANLARYDPASGAALEVGLLGSGRRAPTAVRLASGKVLLAGGGGGDVELFDPDTNQASKVASVTPRSSLAGAQMIDGSVVLAGGVDADGKPTLPIDRLSPPSFSAATVAEQLLGPEARVLALRGGGSLVLGDNFVGLLPLGGGLQYAGDLGQPAGVVVLPEGDILAVWRDSIFTRTSRIDPGNAARTTERTVLGGQENLPKDTHMQALPSGEIFFSFDGPAGRQHLVRETLPRGVARPQITAAPETLVPGTIVSLKGTRLRRLAAVGAQYLAPGADLFPAVMFQREGSWATLARVVQATDDEVSFEVPTLPLPGPGWLYVSVGGVRSVGRFARVTPAEAGRPCMQGAECASAWCVEGVCCDKECNGGCLSCLAARQAAGGQDGRCLAVAAGLDPRNDCEPDETECGKTGVCDGGGSCQLAPTGKACLGGGTCNAGQCLAPLPAACDADGETLVLPDKQRQSCQSYACRDGKCLLSCAQDADCARGFWCSEQGDCRTCSEDLGAVVVGSVELPCAPYACLQGECRGACANDQDCSDGYRCTSGSCGPHCGEDGVTLLSPAGDTSCSPYRCAGDRCAAACVSNAQCAPGMLCGLDGACRALAAAPQAPAAGCSLGGRPAAGAWWLLALVALLRRRVAGLAALATLLAAPGAARAADPPAGEDARLAEAKEEFRKGVLLFEAGDIEMALEHFRRSRALFPSVKNTTNMAVSLERLGRYDEALDLFEEVLTRFPSELTAEERARMPGLVALLRGRVGELDVSSSVDGELFVDGRRRATLPLTTPLRLQPGTRRVRIFKDGHEPFETTLEIRQGERSRVDASLRPLASAGRLRVEEATLVGADVFVDDVRVGELPWEGTLAPGSHVVRVSRGDVGSAPSAVTVLQGQTSLLRPRVGPLGPVVRVAVSPPTAELRLGGVLVGRGSWEGRLPEGTHLVSASEEGYRAASSPLAIPLTSGGMLQLSLAVDTSHPRWPRRPAVRPWATAELGMGLGLSLGSGAETSCGVGCSRGLVSGFTGLLSAGFDLPRGPSLELLAGYLDASGSVDRRLRRPIDPPAFSVDYALQHSPRVRGPLLAAGVSRALPLGNGWALRGALSVGLLIATSGDDVRGTASSGSSQASVRIDNGAAEVSSLPILVMPRVGLERSFGAFSALASLRWLLVTSTGPSIERGTVIVPPNCTPAAPADVGCAPEADLVRNQRSHGLFSLLLPTIGLRYTPGDRAP